MCGLLVLPLGGCGCSEDRGRAAAPKFVAHEGTNADAAGGAGSKKTSSDSETNGLSDSPSEKELFGLPLDIVYENVPPVPEALAQPTPLSAIEGQ